MEITIKKTKYEKIELSKEEMKEITIQYIQMISDIYSTNRESRTVETHKDELWIKHWYDGHGSGITQYERLATPREILFDKVLNILGGDL
jgi:hypothetical protein